MKIATLIFGIIALPLVMQAQNSNLYNLLIGTYTSNNSNSEGIYVFEFNSLTGDFKLKNKAVGVEDPSFLTISANKKNVYSVNETKTGEASAFSFNPKSGELKFINKVASEGAHPCYISIDKNGKNVFVGNYSGGTLAVLPVKEDGSLGSSIQTIEHAGSSINKERQEKAHVHSTVLTPDNNYLLVGDLGIDKIAIYEYEAGKKKPLAPANPGFAGLKAGSGPRHITFHPNNRYAYVIQELTGEITGFAYKDGTLKPFQTISMLPEGFTGEIGAADIHVSPDGKFLYASNRGDANDISIYSVDLKTGRLALVGHKSTLGKAPRNFTIDPSGNFLLVANQDSNNVIVFKRNAKTGLLDDTGKRIDVGKPVCLVFSKID